ncbi:MAG: DUF2080 family transposase-associated protein [Deltaproteobacteria bacterium]|nr:DUF2080 family transposase-associated protein [Deltaproteobacteria bacterium]
MDPAHKPPKHARASKPRASDNLHEPKGKTKFQGYAEEMLQKKVRRSGKSGRVYLPPEWVGKNVKIIRLD